MMKMMSAVGRGRSLMLVVLIAASGCTDNVIGPANELEVSNQVDTFEWQVTALDDVTQTLTYTWAMTGTVANVNQSAGPSGGTATLRVQDDAGLEVYSRSLRDNGTFQTSTGAAGNWTITVTLNDASGAINFRVERP